MASEVHITSVGFLRQLAETFGGTDTVRGRGLHRAAAHMVRMHEEIQRLSVIAQLRYVSPETATATQVRENDPVITAAAQGIAAVVMAEMGSSASWETLTEPDRERFRRCAAAALGAASHVPPCTEEEADDPRSPS